MCTHTAQTCRATTTTPGSASWSSCHGCTRCADARYRKTSSTQLHAMTTKRCIKCKLVKSTNDFSKHKIRHDGLSTRCRSCEAKRSAKAIEQGLKILQSLAIGRGSCEHCKRPYSNEDWHFFEFDHIDPSLKRSRKETDSRWVVAHVVEFTERVQPNLQLLCVKCHKIKSSQEKKLGGAVYEKKYGQLKPALVIQTDLTLFNF